MLWVKSAWSDYYRGGAVDGNFGFLEGGNDGHDAWNFQAFKGKYMLHTIPQIGAAPDNDDKTGWTVICLAKRPEQTGIHIVGWYENATLEGDFVRRPKEMTKYFPASDDPYCYSIQSKTAYLVPPQHRTKPFSHPSIRSASYSYLSGPNVLESNNKKEVKALLLAELERLKSVAIKNPTPDNAPDLDNVFDNPLQGFGTAEHRKAVEVAAVKATISKLKKKGFRCTSREAENVGYDLFAKHKKHGDLHVEVKGTAQADARFFMTANEYKYKQAPQWRLAMVTDALGDPKVKLMTLAKVEQKFDLEPMVWKASLKSASGAD